MAKYQIPCACGRTLVVETAQAGETLRCECGATVAVPTLRQLRELPVAGGEHAAEAREWGALQGLASVCVIAAVLCLGIAGYIWITEPTLPQFNAAANTQFVGQRIDQLTPKEAWQAWHRYESLAANGFTVFEHPATGAIRGAIGSRRLLEQALAGAAAIFLVAAAVMAFGRTGRQGDKETRRG